MHPSSSFILAILQRGHAETTLAAWTAWPQIGCGEINHLQSGPHSDNLFPICKWSHLDARLIVNSQSRPKKQTIGLIFDMARMHFSFKWGRTPQCVNWEAPNGFQCWTSGLRDTTRLMQSIAAPSKRKFVVTSCSISWTNPTMVIWFFMSESDYRFTHTVTAKVSLV